MRALAALGMGGDYPRAHRTGGRDKKEDNADLLIPIGERGSYGNLTAKVRGRRAKRANLTDWAEGVAEALPHHTQKRHCE